MRELTPRQKQILELIQDFIYETGMPPTRAEIAKELGFKIGKCCRRTSASPATQGRAGFGAGYLAGYSAQRFFTRPDGFAIGRAGCCG